MCSENSGICELGAIRETAPHVDMTVLQLCIQFELKTWSYRKTREFRFGLRQLSGRILEVTKKTRHLTDVEARIIQRIAEVVYKSGDKSLQRIIFEFVKKLINILARGRTRRTRGHAITELLTIYPDVILRSSRDPKLFSRAAAHAEKLCSCSNPYSQHALKAFDPAYFADFPLLHYRESAVECLLRIASLKVMFDFDTDHDHLLPAVVYFLSAVRETHDSPHIAAQVFSILCQLIHFRGDGARNEFASLRSSNLLQWPLSHLKKNKTYSKTVIRLLIETFRHADAATKNLIVDMGAFQRVREMFQDRRKDVIALLLDFVIEVFKSPDLLYINHALNSNFIAIILSFVEHPPHVTNLHRRARIVLDTFFEKAAIDQIFRALNDGMVPALIQFLESENEKVVADALKWLLFSIEKLESAKDAEFLRKFRALVSQAEGDKLLIRLLDHKDLRLSRSAMIAHQRLKGRFPKAGRDGPNRFLQSDHHSPTLSWRLSMGVGERRGREETVREFL